MGGVKGQPQHYRLKGLTSWGRGYPWPLVRMGLQEVTGGPGGRGQRVRGFERGGVVKKGPPRRHPPRPRLYGAEGCLPVSVHGVRN